MGHPGRVENSSVMIAVFALISSTCTGDLTTISRVESKSTQELVGNVCFNRFRH